MTAPYGAVEARFVLEQVAMPALRFERGVTVRVVAAISPGTTDYRPTPEARSAGELSDHIVRAELRFLEGAVTGTFPDRILECDTAADMTALAAIYETRATALAEQLQLHAGGECSVAPNARFRNEMADSASLTMMFGVIVWNPWGIHDSFIARSPVLLGYVATPFARAKGA